MQCARLLSHNLALHDTRSRDERSIGAFVRRTQYVDHERCNQHGNDKAASPKYSPLNFPSCPAPFGRKESSGAGTLRNRDRGFACSSCAPRPLAGAVFARTALLQIVKSGQRCELFLYKCLRWLKSAAASGTRGALPAPPRSQHTLRARIDLVVALAAAALSCVAPHKNKQSATPLDRDVRSASRWI